MNIHVKRVLLCIFNVLACVSLCSCSISKPYDIVKTHEEALDIQLKQYNCSFDVLSNSSKDGTTTYTCKTKDERGITFLVNCWDGFVEIPFAFHIPAKTVYSSDTFADALSAYISTTVEELSYDSQSLEEIEDYILKVMSEAYDIFDDYNIQGYRPEISFKITYAGKTNDYVCSSLDREFIKSTLIGELLN